MLLRALAFLFLLVAGEGPIRAAPIDAFTFISGEISFTDPAGPNVKWQRVTLPDNDFVSPEQKLARRQAGLGIADVWLRIKFDRKAIVPGHLLLAVSQTRERYGVTLNGTPIFSTIPAGQQEAFSWIKPELIGLPDEHLNAGANELVLRLRSTSPLVNGAGLIRIGREEPVSAHYHRQFVLEFLGPLVISGTIVLLSLGLLAFWNARRREIEFGLLALVGGLWVARNLHYFIGYLPHANALYWALTVDSLYVLTIALYAFAAEFLKVPGRWRIVRVMSIILGLAIAGRYLSIASGVSDIWALLVVIPAVWFVVPYLYRAWRADHRLEYLVMLVAVIVTNLMSMVDFALLKLPWAGPGFFLQPYSAILIFGAFSFALGRRFLLALAAEETMNEVLEQRVEEARVRLETSETERRRLEVTAAVEQERTRLMREIHDGIGSNLVTALAVAQNQKEDSPTIDTLKRSIADLRAAIDSLEPTEGDLTLLLASFRHRMEPELRKAGLSLKWHVDALPPFEWLEATNALHVLRIFQEIIANCIKHAQATEIAVSCRAQMQGERRGICVEFLDNGIGLQPDVDVDGKGIDNMRSRAKALLGILELGPRPGAKGARTALWLPYDRRAVARPLPRDAFSAMQSSTGANR